MGVFNNLTGSLWVPLVVGDVMSKDVVTICSDETVASAAKMMSENHVSCIVVVDNGGVAGILTETDFLKKVAAREKDFDRIKVREIMSCPVETISPNLSVFDAIAIMEDKHIKRLPILEKKQLAGIVTQTDLAQVTENSDNSGSGGSYDQAQNIVHRSAGGRGGGGCCHRKRPSGQSCCPAKEP